VRVARSLVSTRGLLTSTRTSPPSRARVRLWCRSEEHAMRDELLDDAVISLLTVLVVVSLLWWVL
jgi:hypothetical protein